MNLFEELEVIIKSYYKVNLKGISQEKDYIYSRYIFSKIAFENVKTSKSAIGNFLRKKHDSIINYLNKFDGILKIDKEFEQNYKSILRDFKNLDDSLLSFNERAKKNQLEYHQQRVLELTKELNL